MLATITIAIRPTPNHPSCRSTTVPPARPTCRVESVIALSTTRPHVPPSSGQSTFWRSRRSMPIIGSPANLRHRHLLEEDRVEDPSCDGRRDLAALTAALDEDDDDDLGVTHGREGREPGEVLALLGLGVRDHLRGPRLAGDVDARDLRGDAGAVVHHRPERLAQERPDRGRELHVAGHVELSPAVWAFLRQALWAVVNDGTGIAAKIPGIDIAGKTGTAQMVAHSKAEKGQDLAWFAAFAPVRDPEVVVVVLVERGGKGGQVAAPIARRILNAIFFEKVAVAEIRG